MFLPDQHQHRSPLLVLAGVGMLLLVWHNGTDYLSQQQALSAANLIHAGIALAILLATMLLAYLLLTQLQHSSQHRWYSVAILLVLPYWSRVPLHSISELAVAFLVLLLFFIATLPASAATDKRQNILALIIITATILRPYALFFLLLLPGFADRTGTLSIHSRTYRLLRYTLICLLYLLLAWLIIWWQERQLTLLRSSWSDVAEQWPWEYWPTAIEDIRHKLHALRREYLNVYSKGYVYAVYLLSVSATVLMHLFKGLTPLLAIPCLLAMVRLPWLFEDRQRRMWRRLVLWSLLLLFTLAFVSLTVNPVSALPLVVLLIMPLAALLSHWHEKLQEQPDAWQRYPLYLTYLLLLLTAIQAWIR